MHKEEILSDISWAPFTAVKQGVHFAATYCISIRTPLMALYA